ncbi:MAG: sigma-54-dependent Fis family transcriptional regulator [Deltaproteobacteria bacterium]|nr:sigma-54-dependent Fis family transcriptional regulator [Deltaproteobacteria bacterium]
MPADSVLKEFLIFRNLLREGPVPRKFNILLIDDEPLMRMSISDALKEDGYSVVETGLGREGMGLIRDGAFDIVITDLRLPDASGIDILKSCKRDSPETLVMLITAFGSVDTAVEAMKYGAYDYVTKPFPMDELLLMVKRAVRLKGLEEENLLLKERVGGRYNFSGIISKSDSMGAVIEKVKMVSQADSTVLITGESGTGKELIANAVHCSSPRRDGPFIKISCAALPETLLEAELFGYERGAFTGAVRQKKGRIELADKGTLFLDEIGEMPLALQVKLLRALQEREFDRLGGVETLSVDVRIIAATQKDLRLEAQKGAFREDLYYRLNVVQITLPPLRESSGDTLLLADYFLNYFSGQYKKTLRGFSIAARELLIRYPFPGNVRELENAVERAVVMARGAEIEPWDLSEDISRGINDAFKVMQKIRGFENLSKATKEFERNYIMKALDETKGNKSLAAKVLGVSRKTLWEKCKLLNINAVVKDERDGDGAAPAVKKGS